MLYTRRNALASVTAATAASFAAPSVTLSAPSACKPMTPKPAPPQYGGPHYDGIIDVLEGNGFSFDQMKAIDVGAIFHLTSRGTYFCDRAYAKHKAAALKAKYKWGAFHLVSKEPVEDQLNFLLAHEPLTDPDVAIAVDWEERVAHGGGPASYSHLKAFITALQKHLNDKTPGRWPIVYAGGYLRAGLIPVDDHFLGQCPLWYSRYRNDYPYQVPPLWKAVDLWQFDDENRCYGAPPKSILSGADFSRFYGSKAELIARWPFNSPTHPA